MDPEIPDGSPAAAADEEAIQVICRVRPPNSREASARAKEVVTVSETEGNVVIGALGKQFSFDTVLGPSASQV
jgi:hypothetical protein